MQVRVAVHRSTHASILFRSSDAVAPSAVNIVIQKHTRVPSITRLRESVRSNATIHWFPPRNCRRSNKFNAQPSSLRFLVDQLVLLCNVNIQPSLSPSSMSLCFYSLLSSSSCVSNEADGENSRISLFVLFSCWTVSLENTTQIYSLLFFYRVEHSLIALGHLHLFVSPPVSSSSNVFLFLSLYSVRLCLLVI